MLMLKSSGISQAGAGTNRTFTLLLQAGRGKEPRHTNMTATSRNLKIHLLKIMTKFYADVCTIHSCPLWGVRTFSMKIKAISFLKTTGD